MLKFFIESTVFVVIAFALSLILYVITKNQFGVLIGKEIPSLAVFLTYSIYYVIAFLALTIALAGLYPSFVVSKLATLQSLKGTLKVKKSTLLFKKGLVGLQFGIAIILIIVAMVINKQTDFLLEGDLGYTKEALITVRTPRDWSNEGVQKMQTFKNRFKV